MYVPALVFPSLVSSRKLRASSARLAAGLEFGLSLG
jgi:hypothetical protein